MEYEMYFGSFSTLIMGKVIFEFDDVPFKREGLLMGHMPSSNKIRIDNIKAEDKNKEFLVVRCLNCGLYALEAIDQGQTARARDLFTRLLRSDSSKAEYWLWMSTLVHTSQERIYCLESALRNDPENETAKRGLIILGAREPGNDVEPVPPVKRQWDKEIEEVIEPPKSPFRQIWDNRILRLATGLVALLIIIGIIYVGLSGTQSTPEPVLIYKVSPFPTRTETPTISPTITRTMVVRTRTPTVIGPTPSSWSRTGG